MDKVENFFIKGCEKIHAMSNLNPQDKIKYKQILFQKN